MSQQQQDEEEERKTRAIDDTTTLYIVYFSKTHKQQFCIANDSTLGKSLFPLVCEYAQKNNFPILTECPLLAWGSAISASDTPEYYLGDEIQTSYQHTVKRATWDTTIGQHANLQVNNKNEWYQFAAQYQTSLFECVLQYLEWPSLDAVMHAHAYWRYSILNNQELWNDLYKRHFRLATVPEWTLATGANTVDKYRQRYWILKRQMCPKCTALDAIDIVFYGMAGMVPKGYYCGGCYSSRNDSRCRVCHTFFCTREFA